MLPANGLPWFCQSFHGHCSPPFFVVNAAFWTIKSHSTSTPHSSTRVLYFSGWMPHELHNFKRGRNFKLGSSMDPSWIFRRFDSAPPSRQSPYGCLHPKLQPGMSRWWDWWIHERASHQKSKTDGYTDGFMGEVYTVDGYLSDVCLYQYLERDQTKREHIEIKCKWK